MTVPRETSIPCAPTLVLLNNSVSAERVDGELCDMWFNSIVCSVDPKGPDAPEYAAPQKRFVKMENCRNRIRSDRGWQSLSCCHDRTCMANIRAIASQISVR